MVDAGLELPIDLLAVVCASHGGEPSTSPTVREPAGVVRAVRGRPRQHAGAAARAGSAARAVLRAGGGPTSILQNCSGKHAGMLATCVVNGWPTEGYLDQDHPVQRVIDAYIAKAAGGVVHTGVDGCGAPTAMISLLGLANAVRDLAVRGEATYRAMSSRPELVDGSGRARHRADAPDPRTRGQGRRRRRACRGACRRPRSRPQDRRRCRAGTSPGAADRVALARLRRRRGAGPRRCSATAVPSGWCARSSAPRRRERPECGAPECRATRRGSSRTRSAGGVAGDRGNSGARRWRYDCTPSAKSARPKLSCISRFASWSPRRGHGGGRGRPAASSPRSTSVSSRGRGRRCTRGLPARPPRPGSARLTRPSCAASAPDTLRAENSRSSASDGPTSRPSSHEMPHSAIRPRWANDVVITASWFMNRRSQASTIGTAMPATAPLIAAIDRLAHRHEVGVTCRAARRRASGRRASAAGLEDRLGRLVARRRRRRRR